MTSRAYGGGGLDICDVLVKIPENFVLQSNEHVIGADADDSELSTSNLVTSKIGTAQLHLQSQIDFLNSDL